VSTPPAAPACPKCGRPLTLIRFAGEFYLTWEDGNYQPGEAGTSRAIIHPSVLHYGCGCYETGASALFALLTRVQGHFHA
jgi:hypothetical protein